ncbi:hypothetical protein OIU77_010188 [Salix suchowensis]|uniref:Uncharacterized protein n=1 Tax=Salix suchowensis TaxID=1278906 RepID=A0ABQ9A870_9ROSI|nr:hypothetical protein OIU77_010188 [Salix suchowensis]
MDLGMKPNQPSTCMKRRSSASIFIQTAISFFGIQESFLPASS